VSELRFQFFRALQLTGALVILSVIVCFSGPWNGAHTVGLTIAVPSLILLFTARFQLGHSFAVSPQAKQLVTHGLYSRIRNPMYVFSSLLVLGLFIALQRPVLFVLLAILIAVQIVRAHQEARVLEEKFGDEYRAYRARTWF
jgi:protein-S-isoprenylcysteine O-methyltransferase Ste14